MMGLRRAVLDTAFRSERYSFDVAEDERDDFRMVVGR